MKMRPFMLGVVSWIGFSGCDQPGRSLASTVVPLRKSSVQVLVADNRWSRVRDALTIGQRRVFLGNMPPFVQVVDEDGSTYEFGSSGDGPGELSWPVGITVVEQRLGVFDHGRAALVWFELDGEYVSEEPLLRGASGRMDMHMVSHGDPSRRRSTVSGDTYAAFPNGLMSPQDYWVGQIMVRKPSVDQPTKLFDFRDLERVSGGEVFPSLPLWDACSDGTLLVLDPGARAVRVISPEQRVQKIPLPALPKARVTTEALEEYLVAMARLEGADQGVTESELRQDFGPMLPRVEAQRQGPLPVATDLRCGADSKRIWFRWFDGSGSHPLGKSQIWSRRSSRGWKSFSMPEGFEPLEFLDDVLVGVLEDEFGAPAAAILTLSPQARPTGHLPPSNEGDRAPVG